MKNQTTQTKPIYQYAREIQKDWNNICFGAVPYLEAMQSLDTINDHYGMDTARSIILYFLANASTWRGDKARQIKKELNKLTK